MYFPCEKCISSNRVTSHNTIHCYIPIIYHRKRLIQKNSTKYVSIKVINPLRFPSLAYTQCEYIRIVSVKLHNKIYSFHKVASSIPYS